MKPPILVLAAIGLGPFAAGPVLAAQAPTQPGPAAVTSTPATPAPAAATRNGPTGALRMSHGTWRTSQLVGATVYNEHGDSIGTVDDLLMDSNGKVANAVLSVGGFLGIGAKLVSIPFDQLKFEHSRTGMAAATGTPGAAGGMAGAPGTAAGAAVGGNPAASPAMPTAPAATAARGQAAAEYSLVLPGATKTSLTKAKGFKYHD